MVNHPEFVEQTALFLAAGLVGLAGGRVFRVSSIVGFFAAGALLGPSGLGFLKEGSTSSTLAELGVAFLLLDIGLHLSPRRLFRSRDSRFSLGFVQVFLCAVLAAGFARLYGVDLVASLVIGAGLAISSTAVVLKTLKDRHDLAHPIGRTSIGVLVFQDVFVLLILILLPSLNSDGGVAREVCVGLGQAVLALIGVWSLGRFVMRPLFQWLSTHEGDDSLTLASLFFVFIVAWGASSFGLPLALGAFLAGVALSESSLAAMIQQEIKPFRSVFLSLFFVAVGMSLDVNLLWESPWLILCLAALFLVTKGVVIHVVASFHEVTRPIATRAALTLCQGSEFAFILFALAADVGVLSRDLESLLVAMVCLTLLVAPYLINLGATFDPRVKSGARVREPRWKGQAEASS